MGTKGGFDLAFDAIVTTLETYSAAQIADERFTVMPDYARYFNNQSGAYIFPHIGPITPQPGQSAVGAYFAYDASYYLDLVVAAKGAAGDTYTRADEAAGIRFRYLIQQCYNALYAADSYFLGLDSKLFGKKPFPRFEPFIPEPVQTEQPILSGRMTIDLSISFEPSRLTGTALDKVNVTADIWAAYLEP